MLANAPAATPQGISRAGAAFLRDPESTSYVAELGGLAVFRIPAYGSPSPPRGEHHEAPMVLVQQYYLDADAVRRRENRECLERNAANPCIDRIILLNERLYGEEELGVSSDKIEQRILGKRLRYSDAVRLGQELGDAYVVLANSDIFFDESLLEAKTSELHTKPGIYSQLRHEYRTGVALREAPLFGPRGDSQDAWIWHTSAVPFRQGVDLRELDTELGRPGCDNRMVAACGAMGLTCFNAPQRIRVYHNHSALTRTYGRSDAVGRPWMAIMPCLEGSASFSVFGSPTEPEAFAATIQAHRNKQETFIVPCIGGAEHVVAVMANQLHRTGQAMRVAQSIRRLIPTLTNTGLIVPDLASADYFAAAYRRAFVGCHGCCVAPPWSPTCADYDCAQSSAQEDTLDGLDCPVWDKGVLSPSRQLRFLWTKALRGSRVLIVAQDADLLKEQYDRGVRFGDEDPFPDCTLTFAESPHSAQAWRGVAFGLAYAGWLEEAKEAIKDADVLLCACGGFSNPLCAAVRGMGKSAIAMPRDMSMLFGVYSADMVADQSLALRRRVTPEWVRTTA